MHARILSFFSALALSALLATAYGGPAPAAWAQNRAVPQPETSPLPAGAPTPRQQDVRFGEGNRPPNANSSNRQGDFSGQTLVNPLRDIDTLPELLNAILRAVIRLGVIVLTLALIWVGWLFVKAQGNENGIKEAKRALMYTVIGGLILLGAQAIGLVIQSTVDSLTNP